MANDDSAQDNRPSLMPSMAPSSQPFYSNIPAAPLSSMAYPQAPPVGSSGYGDTTSSDPYSGMGYATLPRHQQPAAHGGQTYSQSAEGYAQAPQGYTQAGRDHSAPTPGYAQSTGGSLTDLYQAPGNPYADRSGRPVQPALDYTQATAPTAAPYSVDPGTYGQQAYSIQITTAPSTAPQPPTSRTPQQVRTIGSAPKKRGRSGFIALLAMIGIFVLIAQFAQGIFSRAFDSDFFTPSLPTVADVDLAEGMCFDTLNYVSSNRLQPVNCDEPHRIEVSANLMAPWDSYPGEDELIEHSRAECRAVADEISTTFRTRSIDSRSLYPSQGTWNSGDRTITCFISSVGTSRLVGSAATGDLQVE